MRLIDADDLLRKLEVSGTPRTVYEIGYFDSRYVAIVCIEEAPTINAVLIEGGDNHGALEKATHQ